jgi:rubrerythrin
MSEQPETRQPETRLEALLSSVSVAEVLETAMAFELNAARLYTSLAGTVAPEMRPLVEELAAEETEHHRLLCELAKDPEFEDHLTHRVEKPTTLDEFSAYVQTPRLPADPLDDDLLAYAQDRERVAYEHYEHLAELATAAPLRSLFRFLRDEEKKHEDKLASRWATMFSIL